MSGSQKDKSFNEKLARYVVSGLSLLGLVVVIWLDLSAEENIPQAVYGIFAGGVLGAEVISGWFKK